MIDAPGWIAVGIAAVALVLAYLTYRSQRGKKQLDYVITTQTDLLPGRVARDLEVRHGGLVLRDPALTILRMVNTGDRPITPEDYETDLVVTLDGVQEIASATWTASRPADLRPDIEIEGECVRLKPTLINPEDMLELQVLSAGKSDDVTVAGRIADLRVTLRDRLPYPPGTGREGEMMGADRFIWFVGVPVAILAVFALMAFNHDTSSSDRLVMLGAAGIVAGVLYPLCVRYLVRRRRIWRS